MLPWSRDYTLWALTDDTFEAYDPTAAFADDAPPLLRTAPLPVAGPYRPSDLTLLPDGERALVFGAGGDVAWRGAVQTIGLTDGEVLTRTPAAVPAPATGIRAAALAPGGRAAFALFGNATRTVTSIDLETGEVSPLGTVDDGAVLAVSWSGTPVVAGGERLFVPDPAGAVEIGSVPGAGELTGLLADPDEERVFAWGGRVLARAVLDGRASADVVSVEPFGGEGATVLAATVRGDIVLALGRTPAPAAEVTLARLDAATLTVVDTAVVSAEAPIGDDAWRLAATFDAELVAVGVVGGTSLQVFTVAALEPAGPPTVLGAPLRDLALWAPVAEVCDGLDEDCDGEIDEDWDVGGVCDAVGFCGAGAWVCEGPREHRCDAYDRAAEADACNGLDDDCDGETDEDVPYLGAAVAVLPAMPGVTPEIVPLPDGPAPGEVAVLHSGSGRLHFARYDRDLGETLAPVQVQGADPAGAVVAAWNGSVVGIAYLSAAESTLIRFVALSVDGEILAGPATIDEVALSQNGTGLSIAPGNDGRFGVLVSIREDSNGSFVVVDSADVAATPPPATVCGGGAWTLPLWFTGGAFATVGVTPNCANGSETLLNGRRWDANGARLADPARELVNQSPNIPYTAYGAGYALDPAAGTVGIAWAPVAWSRTGDPVGTLRYQRFGPTLAAVTQPVTLRLLHPIAAYDGNAGALQIRAFRLVHNGTRGRLGLWHQQDPLRVGAALDEFFAEILPDGTMAAGPVMIEERSSRLRWPETVWFEDRYIFGGFRANLDGSTTAHLRAGPVFCDAVAPGEP